MVAHDAERTRSATPHRDMSDPNSTDKPEAKPALAASAGSAYCGPLPDRMKYALMPVAKMIAYEFGQASKQKSIMVTEEVMELVGLCILGAVANAAHLALSNRKTLLADPTVLKWTETPNS